jgi:IclR family acetate operon transcriptional repressor
MLLSSDVQSRHSGRSQGMESDDGAQHAAALVPQRAGRPADDQRYQVQSVGRALDIVALVADGAPDGLSAGEISKIMGLATSSVLATVRTLVAHGYLQATRPGPRYRLGMGLIRLGDLSAQQFPVAEICNPILREIMTKTRFTARAAVADDGYPLFVNRVDGPGTVRFHTPLGRREPAHATAAGKAILATMSPDAIRAKFAGAELAAHTRHTITSVEALIEHLASIGQRGFAVDDEEDVQGVVCIGAAFFNHQDACTGALSLTGLKADLPAWKIAALGLTLRTYADRVSGLVGGRPYADLRPRTSGGSPDG